jgi:hypothetical protein
MNTIFPIPPANETAINAEVEALAGVFVETFGAAPNLAHQVAETIIGQFHQQVRVLVGALAEELGSHLYGDDADEVAH